jgi:hypothetical protein
LVEEKSEKNRGFTCPSDSCGKTFTKPLRAMNLQLGPNALYEACPYCLTKLNPNGRPEVVTVEDSRSCQHHIGYLYNHKKKTDIPDECMICKDVVACMLGTLKK